MEDERRIILADGTILEDCGAGYDGATFWIYPEMTMKAAADLFLDEVKTAVITYERGGETIQYIGFTDCILMNVVPGGLRIQMTGTETNVEEGNESEA